MKVIFTLLIMTSVFSMTGLSQCVPGSNFQDSIYGCWPDTIQNLPPAQINSFYSTDINFILPDYTTAEMDPTFVGYPISEYTITGVSGLPSGFSFQCNDLSCNYTGGVNGCGTISGICSVPGIYDIELNLQFTTMIDFFGPPEPYIVNWSFPGYKIDVAYCSIDSVLFIESCNEYNLNGQIYSESGTYTQTLQSNQGCDSIITLELFIPEKFTIPICAVGVYNGNNRVVWDKPLTDGIESFNVYRESTQSGMYQLIGSNNYADSSLFIDVNSNPDIQSSRYKISYIDTCGIEFPLSDEHKTIHLTINQGVGQTWNLIWSHYEGFNFVTYEILRGTNPNNMTSIATIQSTLNSYTDITAPPGQVYYQIVAVNPNGCNPSKIGGYSSSVSNIIDTETLSLTEFNQELIKVSPNPATSSITISAESYDVIGKEFNVTNILGQVVITGQITKQEIVVDLTNLLAGIYLININGESQSTFKIVKE